MTKAYRYRYHDLKIDIASGRVPGVSWVDIFGYITNLDSSAVEIPVWEHGTNYTFTANEGATQYMSSSDDDDTQELSFDCLVVDESGNWNRELFTQNLAGQTKTEITPPSGNLIVRYNLIESIAERGSNIAGQVYFYEDTTPTLGVPSDDTKIRARINDGNNQTRQCIFTIPSGKVGLLVRGEIGMSFTGVTPGATDYVRGSYRSGRYNTVFLNKKTVSCMGSGNSNYKDLRPIPDPIPAKTDIYIQVDEISTNMDVEASMDILLFDEDIFDETYLSLIGQIAFID